MSVVGEAWPLIERCVSDFLRYAYIIIPDKIGGLQQNWAYKYFRIIITHIKNSFGLRMGGRTTSTDTFSRLKNIIMTLMLLLFTALSLLRLPYKPL